MDGAPNCATIPVRRRPKARNSHDATMMKKNLLRAAAAVLLIGCVTLYFFAHPQRSDTRYSGAYKLEGHSFVFIAPDGADRLRYRTLSGRSGLLWPAGGHRFTGGKGWDDREPVANTFTFEMDAQGRPQAVVWEQPGTPAVRAVAADISEQTGVLRSGDLMLHYRFVRPAGQKPQAAVAIVYGSQRNDTVERRFEPYLYAASGFATLAFDQRGTGSSQGEYTQNVAVLADDAAAALRWLREQPRIDQARVHLVAFDEGGWVAPLAAAKDRRVRSLLVNCGPLVSAAQADRWRYVYALRQRGFGDDAIARADAINDILSDIVDRGANRWAELGASLKAAHDAPWFGALEDSESLLGHIAHRRAPLWVTRLGRWWKFDRANPVFVDRLYDPTPAAMVLHAPSYWIFGQDDARMPTDWTLDELNSVQKRGRPVDYLVYPDVGHGALRMEKLPDGKRRVLGYEPDYFKVQVDWLRRNSRQ